MTWQEQRKALENLSERDKRILDLARKIDNNMGFALQNAGRAAEERYAAKAEDAMRDLINLLIDEPPSAVDPNKAA